MDDGTLAPRQASKVRSISSGRLCVRTWMVTSSGIIFLDELADEVEIGLGRRGKADLDFLEAHVAEQPEHAHLAVEIHRHDERLVAVAQVDAHQTGGLVRTR